MKKINPAHIKNILSLINNSPFFKLLSMRVCDMGTGWSRVELELNNKHMNPFGSVHGGAVFSLIDTAAYWSVYCGMDENTGYTTIDLKSDNLSVATTGILTAEGRVIKQGKSLCLAEATVKAEDGRLIAHGTSRLIILDDRQTISYAVTNSGSTELPDKFILGDQ